MWGRARPDPEAAGGLVNPPPLFVVRAFPLLPVRVFLVSVNPRISATGKVRFESNSPVRYSVAAAGILEGGARPFLGRLLR
jgi:hypothetical protein